MTTSAQESQAARVYMLLKEDILTAVIRPGEMVMEPELARRHVVSRTPVREALKNLENEGWVVSLPQRGYVVRPLSFHDVREVMDLRLILEPPLAAAAARATSPELAARLQATITAQYLTGATLGQRLRSAESFHMECVSASGNHRAAGLLRPLVDEISRLHYLMPQVRLHLASGAELDAHAGIARAITEGAAERSAALMHAHLRESSATMMAAF